MARVENAIKNLVDVFHQYAKLEGKKRMLNKEELKSMLEAEMQSDKFKKTVKADVIDEAWKMMDKNNDGNIRFGEFYRGMGIMARAYYQEEYGKKGKEDGQEA